MVIRRYSLSLLISILVILTGFGGVAHTLSNGCVGLHCKDHLLSTEHSAVAKHIDDVSAPSRHHDPESFGTGECNPSLCQAVVLLSQSGEVVWNQSEIDRELQIGALAKLIEPDSPYRPPDV